MPIADKSIIDPAGPKPTIPFKKSTVLGVLGVVLGVVLVVSTLTSKDEPIDPLKAAASQELPEPILDGSSDANNRAVVGSNNAAIDEERSRVERELERQRQGQAERERLALLREAIGLPENTTPQSQRPITSPAAFGAARAAGQLPASAPQQDLGQVRISALRGSDGSELENKNLEMQAVARKSKSLAFDVERVSGGSGTSPQGDGYLAQFGSSSDSSSDRSVPSLSDFESDKPKTPSYEEMRGMMNGAMGGNGNAPGNSQGGSSGSARYQGGDKGFVSTSAVEGAKKGPLTSSKTESIYTLHQGKIMNAVLLRDINTDLPGTVTACTTSHVYDSMGYGNLLIPMGACLVGMFNSEIAAGQSRVMFAFTRLIMPNGLSFDLPGATASDVGGASGLEANVNNHFFKMFSSAFIVAWLTDKTQVPDLVVNGTSANESTMTAAGQVLVDVSRTILDRNKNIQPTLTLEKGTRINIEVVRDMEFPGPYTWKAGR